MNVVWLIPLWALAQNAPADQPGYGGDPLLEAQQQTNDQLNEANGRIQALQQQLQVLQQQNDLLRQQLQQNGEQLQTANDQIADARAQAAQQQALATARADGVRSVVRQLGDVENLLAQGERGVDGSLADAQSTLEALIADAQRSGIPREAAALSSARDELLTARYWVANEELYQARYHLMLAANTAQNGSASGR